MFCKCKRSYDNSFVKIAKLCSKIAKLHDFSFIPYFICTFAGK